MEPNRGVKRKRKNSNKGSGGVKDPDAHLRWKRVDIPNTILGEGMR